MSEFRGGERPDVVARKMRDRQDSRRQWGFPTHFEFSTSTSAAQLGSDVHARTQGKQL
jgi:hypothetical protein